MKVKGRLNSRELELNNLTKHFSERETRMKIYSSIKNLGNVYDSFVVDKNHPNGDEVHVLTDTGFILIFNERTKKFITLLHARPMQLKRYYINLGEEIPLVITNICESNNKLNKELQLNKK
jgi:hypothetical protein